MKINIRPPQDWGFKINLGDLIETSIGYYMFIEYRYKPDDEFAYKLFRLGDNITAVNAYRSLDKKMSDLVIGEGISVPIMQVYPKDRVVLSVVEMEG